MYVSFDTNITIDPLNIRGIKKETIQFKKGQLGVVGLGKHTKAMPESGVFYTVRYQKKKNN